MIAMRVLTSALQAHSLASGGHQDAIQGHQHARSTHIGHLLALRRRCACIGGVREATAGAGKAKQCSQIQYLVRYQQVMYAVQKMSYPSRAIAIHGE